MATDENTPPPVRRYLRPVVESMRPIPGGVYVTFKLPRHAYEYAAQCRVAGQRLWCDAAGCFEDDCATCRAESTKPTQGRLWEV